MKRAASTIPQLPASANRAAQSGEAVTEDHQGLAPAQSVAQPAGEHLDQAGSRLGDPLDEADERLVHAQHRRQEDRHERVDHLRADVHEEGRDPCEEDVAFQTPDLPRGTVVVRGAAGGAAGMPSHGRSFVWREPMVTTLCPRIALNRTQPLRGPEAWPLSIPEALTRSPGLMEVSRDRLRPGSRVPVHAAQQRAAARRTAREERRHGEDPVLSRPRPSGGDRAVPAGRGGQDTGPLRPQPLLEHLDRPRYARMGFPSSRSYVEKPSLAAQLGAGTISRAPWPGRGGAKIDHHV